MLKITIRKKAEKFYNSLAEKQKVQILAKIEQLQINPFSHDSKKLKGFPCYSVSVGEFRVIYLVETDEVEIVSIAKRSDDDSYKFLHRFFLF